MTCRPFQLVGQQRRRRRDLSRSRRSAPFPRAGGWRDARRHSHHGPTYPAYPVPGPAQERHEHGGDRYQLPLSPVPYRAPFDEARHPVLPPPPPPPRVPSPTSPRPGFLEGFREPFRAQERSSLLGSGNYIILRGGSFVDDYSYLDNHVSARPYHHQDRRPDIIDNFRDFAEFAHGSEPAYSLAVPERRMSTAESSTAAVSAPAANGTRPGADERAADAEEEGRAASGESADETSGRGETRRRQAANIQEILSDISNDVQADRLPDHGTSHVKKRVLKDKRLRLRRQRQKQASLESRQLTDPEPEDPMVATF